MANGEGYIRSRSQGSHTITIYLGKDENGKSRQHVETIRGSEKDAKAHMARLIAERDKGVDLKPEQATFEELVQRWRDSHYPDLAQSTVDTHETLLSVHVLPVIGTARLRDIRPLHVEAVKTGVTRAWRSQKLALNVFRLMAAILRQAVRWQLISINPADAVTPPRARRYRAQAPTQEQLAALLAGC